MRLTKNAIAILKERYLKVTNGIQETPEEMFQRVASNIAEIEERYGKDVSSARESFLAIMRELDFLPNSPTLMNAGRDLQQLSACFVLPIEDSLESIFDTLKNAALIQKSGGGTGFSFSRIRPKNDLVKTTGGRASGPISFIKCYDAVTEAVKQGGVRRGANMAILRVDHPDILEFIRAKADTQEINNFNISVALTDHFMKAVENNEDYPLINPATNQEVRKIKAKQVFDLIVEMAWQNGEPGIVFIDRMNEHNPTPKVGQFEATNPCAEQPLLAYESCNLGSINLANMVKSGSSGWEINWDKLESTIQVAVHFLDNVIDANRYPLKEIEKMTKGNRKIGLGVMGFADLLIKLDIPYNSEEGVSLARTLMQFIEAKAHQASGFLAKERGVFPNYDQSVYPAKSKVMRNATVTTIAPTGTISIIANCSGGIEPLFALAYTRRALDDQVFYEVNPMLENFLREKGLYVEELITEIIRTGSLNNELCRQRIPEDIRKVFVTAHEISPIWHVRMQAAFQEFTDNAVSKTVNFPQEATKDDVRQVFLEAYRNGCKGVTVYRSGSRPGQVLTVGCGEDCLL